MMSPYGDYNQLLDIADRMKHNGFPEMGEFIRQTAEEFRVQYTYREKQNDL